MSNLLFVRGSSPGTPASTKAIAYVDSEGCLHVISSTGVDILACQRARPNFLRNSGFWFAQRQAPGTLTTYSNVGGRIIAGADGWGISNENASTQFRRVDSSGAFESGLQNRYWGEYTKITSTGKILLTQVIEGVRAQALRGRTVRLQAWIKAIVGTPIAMNIALVNWTSTLDTVPSGAGLYVTAHGANGVDPTLATNLAYLTPKLGVTGDNCTGSVNAYKLSATTTWQRFGGVFDVPTTVRNLIVMIWTDNQVVATNGFGISQVSLTDGFEIVNWAPLTFAQEVARVERYYQKTFALDTAPAQNVGVATGAHEFIAGVAGAAQDRGWWPFKTRMRAAPGTLTTYNPAAANAFIRDITGAVDTTANAITASGETGARITCTGNAATAVGNILAVHCSADAEL